MKTNKQFLIDEIKKTLDRDDLAANDRVRLLALLEKHVPPTRSRRKPAKAAKPAHVQRHAPFQKPA